MQKRSNCERLQQEADNCMHTGSRTQATSPPLQVDDAGNPSMCDMIENGDSDDEAAWQTAKEMFQRMQTLRMMQGGSPTHQYLAGAARPPLQTASSIGTTTPTTVRTPAGQPAG